MADLTGRAETVHIETLVVELPAAEITALLAGSTAGLRAAVETAVLADETVRRRVEAAPKNMSQQGLWSSGMIGPGPSATEPRSEQKRDP
ncbi:hypothetical protein OHS18_12035 [Amycolatopsis sp. NBC_00355]|uniref:hypothetical protein n=1 Tax=Amycolatopsis sp. NBC_00355 TaxID=2975957 RepID=UPI002E264036